MRLHSKLVSLNVLGLLLCAAEARAANKTVCVQVQIREPAPPVPFTRPRGVVPEAVPEALPLPAPPSLPSSGDLSGLTPEQRRIEELRAIQSGRARAVATSGSVAMRSASTNVPVGFEAVDYLKRLLEHFITHERGYTAVQSGCHERFDVELYPLSEGWTAFARYSGTGREERIDQLYPDELSQFAERAVLALLYGRPISATLLRDTVLRADSRRVSQRVRGTNHFELKLGTGLRGGRFPTAQGDGSVSPEIRVWSPVNLALGYRGRFESWGMEVTGNVDIGTSKTGIAQNPSGGHIDLGGDAGMSLHFLRYANPRGIMSMYLGAGTTFGLQWLTTVLPQTERTSSDRRTWLSGGLDVDLLIGTEFMRASRAQFLIQGMLHLPAYVVNQEDRLSKVLTWMPGFTLQLGVMF